MAPRQRRRLLHSISSILTVGVLALSLSIGLAAAGEAPAQAAFIANGDGSQSGSAVMVANVDGPITKIHKEGYCAMNGQVRLAIATFR